MVERGEMKVMNMKRIKKKQSWDDRLFSGICSVFLVLFVLIVAYPIYFVVIASFSDPSVVNSGAFLLYPKGFTTLGYQRIFQDERIWVGYGNTIIYTVTGTVLGTAATVMAGYALSRKDLPARGILMKLLVFTMYFSGGMIPQFLVVKQLGLLNSRWSVILLGAVSAYNIIIVRSFMESTIPEELMDAAKIDGCGNGKFFLKVVLPLSKAVIAVMVLYIAVAYWNSYFNAMMYLTEKAKYPLQMYLREILLVASAMNTSDRLSNMNQQNMDQLQTMVQVIKYGVIVVATAPIICVYPFIQRYFIKGVMIGSIKG